MALTLSLSFAAASIIINYYQLLSIIINYYQLLSIIINYYQLLSIIINYYQLLSIIISVCLSKAEKSRRAKFGRNSELLELSLTCWGDFLYFLNGQKYDRKNSELPE